MTFAAAISRATDRVYARFGVAAVYRDRDGVETPCTVLVERDLARYGEVAQVQGSTAVVGVRVTEVFERPRRGELFTLVAGAEVLRVESLVSGDGVEHKVGVAA